VGKKMGFLVEEGWMHVSIIVVLEKEGVGR
jgi:hypothetical protein